MHEQGKGRKPRVVLVSLNAKYIHTNLAIRYLEAYYRKHSFEAFPVDFIKKEYTINQQTSQIIADLYEEKADLIGFSCYIWNIDMILTIVQNLKQVAMNTKIVLGGPEVSFDAQELMEQYPLIDYIICGEGEKSFAKLVERLSLEGSSRQYDVANTLPATICHRDSQYGGQLIHATEQARHADLTVVPSPYEYDFDQTQFANRIIYYETSRGCPYSCQYCLSSADHGVRFFPLDRVKQDLLRFIEAEVKQVKFVDRTFNCSAKYAKEIFQWIIDHQRGKTNFHFEISADLLSEDMISYLHQAPKGLFQFEIGVQTTNERTLEAIQRKMDFDKLRTAVQGIQKGDNIHQHLDLIVGLPHENYQRFSQSFNDVFALKPDKLQMGFLKLLKGSGLRRKEQEYGFVYSVDAPYEIMANNDLNYAEMIKLKEIEHVVDHYYNSHQFDRSLEWISGQLQMSPFTFFESLANYCKRVGFFERAHSQGAMYENLYNFAVSNSKEIQLLALKEIMKFDFVRLSPHGKLPDCLEAYQTDDFKKSKQSFLSNPDYMEEFFPEYKELNMRNRTKYVHVEAFRYDVMGDRGCQDTIYLFIYANDPLQYQRARWLDVTDYFRLELDNLTVADRDKENKKEITKK